MLSPVVVIILGGLLVLMIIYHFYRKILLFQQENYILPPGTVRSSKSVWWWLSPAIGKQKNKSESARHRHKIRSQQREHFLTEIGLKPEPSAPTHIHRLKSMVHAHERRHQSTSEFANLDHLVKKIKDWEEDKPLSEEEIDKIVQGLREISRDWQAPL